MEIVQRTNGPVTDPSTQLFPPALLLAAAAAAAVGHGHGRSLSERSHSGWPGLVGHNLRETC